MHFPVPPRPDSEPASPTPELPRPPNGLPPSFQGSFRLFRLAGADVYVHWSWFVVAFFLIQDRPVPYSSLAWDVAEYVAGFALVLLHEFGHVLACRSVGGTANRVLLWPLGGLAFVATPPRPGANLWTTAAGPLVNVFLTPVLIGLALATGPTQPDEALSDFHHLFWALSWFNIVMLAFNLLPIFPLDGGQLLHSILWFWLGRVRGLAISAGIGLVAGAGLILLALANGQWWFVAMAGFLMLGAYGGLKQARALSHLNALERRTDRKCPHCNASPLLGEFWQCMQCRCRFDVFEFGSCPKCGSQIAEVPCLDCGKPLPASGWISSEPTPNAQGWFTSEGNRDGRSP